MMRRNPSDWTEHQSESYGPYLQGKWKPAWKLLMLLSKMSIIYGCEICYINSRLDVVLFAMIKAKKEVL